MISLRRNWRVPWWAWAVHLLTLVGGGVFILYLSRHMWFFGDDWDFMVLRGLHHPALSLWQPHTDHWSTLPILIYRALLTAFGISSYRPFLVVLVLMHLALAHLLWRVSLRVGAYPLIATVVAGTFAVAGVGWEDLVWAFQIGFVGAALCGWAWVLLVDRPTRSWPREAAGWVVGVAAMMFSGIGVPMAGVVGLAVLLRRGWRQALVTVSVPVAAFLVWFAAVGRSATRSAPITAATLAQDGPYTLTGVANALGRGFGMPAAGPVLAAALAYALLRRGRGTSRRPAAAVAGAVGILGLFAFIGIGRAGLGTAESTASRYVYLGLALIVPAVALCLSTPLLRGTARRLFLLAVALLVVANNIAAMRAGAHHEIGRAVRVKGQILAAYQLVRSGAFVFPGAVADPVYSPQATVAGLRQVAANGWLPLPAHVSAQDHLTAQVRLQVGLVPLGAALPLRLGAARLAGAAQLSWSRPQGACRVATPTGPDPQLVLRARGVAQELVLRPRAPGSIQVALTSPAAPAPSPRGKPLVLSGARRLVIAATGVGTEVALPPGSPTTVCGLAVL